MTKHWVVLVAGALLIPAAASARSAHRIQAPPKPAPPRAAAPPAAEPTFSEEDLEPCETFEPTLNLEIQAKVDDPCRSMVQTWIAWRRQSIDALPENLREKSDYQAAIDETFRTAIRSFLSPELAAQFDPDNFADIINGVGFTDIDEQSEELIVNGGLAAAAEDPTANLEYLRARERTRLEWMRWMRDAIESLPESLRKDSDYLKAIQDMYRSGAGEGDFYSVEELSIDIISRPPIGGHDIGGIGFTDIDERADNSDGTDVGYILMSNWGQWKKQAIASLPEGLRENSEYQAAIEALYQAATK